MAEKPEVCEDPRALLENFLCKIPQGKLRLRMSRKNRVLFHQGDRAEALYFLHSGTVKLVVVSACGREATFATVRPGEFFGLARAEEEEHLGSAITLEPVVATRIERKVFFRMLRENPTIYGLVASVLSSQILHLQRGLCAQLLDCGQQRLARILVDLSSCAAGPLQGTLALKVSHRVLASMAGTTRSRVTFFMGRFRRLGYVAPGRPTIIHTSKLASALRSGLLDRPSGFQ